ncbi:hypothetical protein BZA05DRAFT_190865 [Tricharina praecox]|uniref:uncharacterized protein n=1 Tax=Tricharina praecox TaxID=43433 RepID=UPI00221F215C|nr:uncharacterized protein BZA05DRAFT_190865 [Tricharina praecox]KAI5842792.1 hypothetical protein BZA05DRAFT_190865 [Tricharina praecox]
MDADDDEDPHEPADMCCVPIYHICLVPAVPPSIVSQVQTYLASHVSAVPDCCRRSHLFVGVGGRIAFATHRRPISLFHLLLNGTLSSLFLSPSLSLSPFCSPQPDPTHPLASFSKDHTSHITHTSVSVSVALFFSLLSLLSFLSSFLPSLAGVEGGDRKRESPPKPIPYPCARSWCWELGDPARSAE